MNELWARLLAWLATNAPTIQKRLQAMNPDVRGAHLLRLERALDATLLDEFKDFYAAHNGQRQSSGALFDGAHWLSLTESLEVWHAQRSAGWNRYWVAFAHDARDKSYLCHDLQPPPGEPVGQVIRVSKYSNEPEVAARSLTQWFADYVADAEAGRLKVVEKQGLLRAR
jgi:cell wall assembly regulator SMI1